MASRLFCIPNIDGKLLHSQEHRTQIRTPIKVNILKKKESKINYWQLIDFSGESIRLIKQVALGHLPKNHSDF